jgi:uncharacterized protein YlxW (UPF0749 family)
LVLTAVLGLLGFLLVTAAFSARTTKRTEAPRKTALIRQIEDRRSKVVDLEQAVRSLRSDVQAEELSQARINRTDRAEAERTSELARRAGTVALKGAGLVVHLSDSSRKPPSTGDTGAYRIHDSDLQLVVNALFEAGADAVAINDSRVVATTPIRAAGDTIVVNFRPLTPPYSVSAIGAGASRFGKTKIAARFHRWTSLFGLGFSVSSSRDVTVPAYAGRVQITAATPGS